MYIFLKGIETHKFKGGFVNKLLSIFKNKHNNSIKQKLLNLKYAEIK